MPVSRERECRRAGGMGQAAAAFSCRLQKGWPSYGSWMKSPDVGSNPQTAESVA